SVEQELALLGAKPTEDVICKLVETRLRDEINRGVQTIQYQVVTLMTFYYAPHFSEQMRQ
ncbi:MAG: hypothetical protein IKC07_05370, partial [Clostridia bacterium]|nr:hypothetical protein [Clostridia bacterium]